MHNCIAYSVQGVYYTCACNCNCYIIISQWTLDGKSGGKKGKVNVAKRGRGIGRKKVVSRKPRSSSESSDEEEDELVEGVSNIMMMSLPYIRMT